MRLSTLRHNNLFINALVTLVLTAVGCEAFADNKIKKTLNNIASQCTESHGYDWRDPGELGDYELERNEKAWRACVYCERQRGLA